MRCIIRHDDGGTATKSRSSAYRAEISFSPVGWQVERIEFPCGVAMPTLHSPPGRRDEREHTKREASGTRMRRLCPTTLNRDAELASRKPVRATRSSGAGHFYQEADCSYTPFLLAAADFTINFCITSSQRHAYRRASH